MTGLPRQLPLDIKLRDDATFATYQGEAPVKLRATPGIVYLWGQPGTGRSHLLQAACHAANASGRTSIYLVAPEHGPGILTALESIDVVCVDDLQAVVGDATWESELFHLVNGVRDNHRTLILSANCGAHLLPVQLPDLKSRLLGAAQIETDVLGDDAKVRLLQQKAGQKGFVLPLEVARFIMSRTNRDMPSLLSLLARLDVETMRQQKKVTIPFVKQMLGS